LSEVLYRLGVDYDEYFTIEEAWSTDGSSPMLRNRQIVRPEGKPGLTRELEQIRRTLPDFAYSLDRRQPRVVHVMDSRLLRQKRYSMNATVKHLDLSGTVLELVSAISGQGIPVSPERQMGTEEFLFADFKTMVHVKGKSLKVRDALTDFIPLRGRTSRILWIAETKLGTRETTYIRFQGAAR
jgi:hypothetical protein